MKKLSDSHIFSKLINNKSLLEKMSKITSNVGLNIQTKTDLANEYNTINRRINYSTKGTIMNMIEKGNIIVYDNPEYNLPTYITAIPGRNVNGSICMYVNINRFKAGKLNEIYPKTLFALLQNALIFKEVMLKWDSFANNIELMKLCSNSYSRLMTKILDKTFALDLDPFKSDFMSYAFAKFFLINVCERKDSSLNDDLAYKSCFNKSSCELIKEFEKELPDNLYNSIFELFDGLKNVKGFEKLSFRSFLENYVRMYGEGSLLALDYLPAFIQMISSSVIGGNIVKDYFIDSVSGKFNNKIYVQFCSIV